jgi:hypothetical protein
MHAPVIPSLYAAICVIQAPIVYLNLRLKYERSRVQMRLPTTGCLTGQVTCNSNIEPKLDLTHQGWLRIREPKWVPKRLRGGQNRLSSPSGVEVWLWSPQVSTSSRGDPQISSFISFIFIIARYFKETKKYKVNQSRNIRRNILTFSKLRRE